jgi:hypothetical protein
VAGEWRRLHKEELHELDSRPDKFCMELLAHSLTVAVVL